MDQLGVSWSIHFSANGADIPAHQHRVQFIGRVTPGQLHTAAEVDAMVQGAPAGSAWYIGGELNDPVKFVAPADYAVSFEFYRDRIKLNDPSAKILGPSMLNWWFTCFECGGYTKGSDWVPAFISAYQSQNVGAKPPVDAWLIDVYPIDWRVVAGTGTVPNSDWTLMRDQLIGAVRPIVQSGGAYVPGIWTFYEGMRQYLNSQGYTDTPIWVTEMAVHWGYDDMIFPPATPAGNYRWDVLSVFLNDLIGWLKVNAVTYNIEKWFLFNTWVNIAEPRSDGYAGVILFNNQNSTTPPVTGVTPRNCLGEIYRRHSLNIQPFGTCTMNGVWQP